MTVIDIQRDFSDKGPFTITPIRKETERAFERVDKLTKPTN